MAGVQVTAATAEGAWAVGAVLVEALALYVGYGVLARVAVPAVVGVVADP